MKYFLLIFTTIALIGCAQKTPQYVAPNTSSVTKSIIDTSDNIDIARKSNLDAKDEIKQAQVISGRLKQQLNQIKAHH